MTLWTLDDTIPPLRKRGLLLVLAVVAVVVTLVLLLAPETNAQPAAVIPAGAGELIVGFRPELLPGSASQGRAQSHQAARATERKALARINASVVQVSDRQAAAAVYRRNPNVRYVEPQGEVQAFDVPTDPRWPEQYGPVQVQAPAAWDMTTGSASQVIAIIDTGVDCYHEDLVGRCLPGHNVTSANPDDWWDWHGHGTHVAGIAAAATGNGKGMAGMDRQARILPVRVLNFLGSGTTADTAEGIVWAADNGATVANLSLGRAAYSQVVADAVAYAQSRDVLIVAALGNTGTSIPDAAHTYPAEHPGVLAVAATDATGGRAAFSSYGPAGDIAAPGDAILSLRKASCVTCTSTQYRTMSGTSMATPHVAGAASLLRAHVPGLTQAQVAARLTSMADPCACQIAGGRLNVYRALTEGGTSPSPAPTPAPTPTPTPAPLPVVTLATGETEIRCPSGTPIVVSSSPLVVRC